MFRHQPIDPELIILLPIGAFYRLRLNPLFYICKLLHTPLPHPGFSVELKNTIQTYPFVIHERYPNIPKMHLGVPLGHILNNLFDQIGILGKKLTQILVKEMGTVNLQLRDEEPPAEQKVRNRQLEVQFTDIQNSVFILGRIGFDTDIMAIQMIGKRKKDMSHGYVGMELLVQR
jgi:hypothetical protein